MNIYTTATVPGSTKAGSIEESRQRAILNIRERERQLFDADPDLAIRLDALRIGLIRITNGQPMRINSFLKILGVRDGCPAAETNTAEVACAETYR